jgi:biotin-(acetyl-CoA carboxylase) ligase
MTDGVNMNYSEEVRIASNAIHEANSIRLAALLEAHTNHLHATYEHKNKLFSIVDKFRKHAIKIAEENSYVLHSHMYDKTVYADVKGIVVYFSHNDPRKSFEKIIPYEKFDEPL